MRLKTFSGKTMKEVMTAVREEMGADAIIVSIDQGKRVGGVRVTAAVENDSAPKAPAKPKAKSSPAVESERRLKAEESRPYDVAELKAVISHHGLPFDLADRMQEACSAIDADSLPEAIATALDNLIAFEPLQLPAMRPLMLIGPPGAGKTVSTAKLAAEAALNGQKVRLITTDTVKSGGVQQLDRLAQLMELTVETAAEPEELSSLLASGDPDATAIIDTRGTNPFNMDEILSLARFVKHNGVEPVLVLPAGIDAMEAGDIAEVFASTGARRAIFTRLDTARRYASVLTAARNGKLAIAAVSRSPYVAEGLETPTPLLIARIFASLPRAPRKVEQKERIAQ